MIPEKLINCIILQFISYNRCFINTEILEIWNKAAKFSKLVSRYDKK